MSKTKEIVSGFESVQRERVAEMRRGGMGVDKIAKVLGVGHRTVRRWTKPEKKSPRQRREERRANDAAAAAVIESNWNDQANDFFAAAIEGEKQTVETRRREASERDASGERAELESYASEKIEECALCGGEIFERFANKRGEVFCSKYHREKSNRMLKNFLAANK